MNIASCMKTQVISIPATASIREAAALFLKKHIGLLPVVDKDGTLLGALGIHDLLKLEMPDFVNFMPDVDFVHDFGAVEDMRPPATVMKKNVRTVMRPVISVEGDSGLLRAYSLMLQQNLHDITVVSAEGKLIGIASRVDIGMAIIRTWEKAE